jgi:hypothetical protein
MNTKPKYIISAFHGNKTIVLSNKTLAAVCECSSEYMARKITRALNAMEKPKGKPLEFDWSGIPKEFKWAAMDADEAWYAYAAKPDGTDKASPVFIYDEDDARSLEINRPPYPGDWRDSLQKRP